MAVANNITVQASTEPEQMNQKPNKFRISLFWFLMLSPILCSVTTQMANEQVTSCFQNPSAA
jgi:hypothetical protein